MNALHGVGIDAYRAIGYDFADTILPIGIEDKQDCFCAFFDTDKLRLPEEVGDGSDTRVLK